MVAICTHDLVKVRLAEVKYVLREVLSALQGFVLPVIGPTSALQILQVDTRLMSATNNLRSKILKIFVFVW